jgi:hypothetical protein
MSFVQGFRAIAGPPPALRLALAAGFALAAGIAPAAGAEGADPLQTVYGSGSLVLVPVQ